ncbi:hypothetical protein Pmani_021418 [Petrolisthes manimaculis]|uniref:Uncharacterized protein n=1 Tax=Petrolisthes manimaculis TaxID=1843537 RepID=A0AAE1PES7_9EUCA|nr:hypothetical protein Pmani_021418 [Petrolisthes manimaculis]
MASQVSQIEEIPRNDELVPQICLKIINLNLHEHGGSIAPHGMGEEERRGRARERQLVVRKHQLQSYDHLLQDLPLVRLTANTNTAPPPPRSRPRQYQFPSPPPPLSSRQHQHQPPSPITSRKHQYHQSTSPTPPRKHYHQSLSPTPANRQQHQPTSRKHHQPPSPTPSRKHHHQSLSPTPSRRKYHQTSPPPPYTKRGTSRQRTSGFQDHTQQQQSPFHQGQDSVFVIFVQGMNNIMKRDGQKIIQTIVKLLDKNAEVLLEKDHQLSTDSTTSQEMTVNNVVKYSVLHALNELVDEGVLDISRSQLVAMAQCLTVTVMFRGNLTELGRQVWNSSYAQVFRDAWMSFGCLGAVFLISAIRQ